MLNGSRGIGLTRRKNGAALPGLAIAQSGRTEAR
jgi:hypothetical protein